MHIVIVVVVVRHADFDMTHASWNCRATSSNQKHARTLPGLRQAQPALVSDRLWVCMLASTLILIAGAKSCPCKGNETLKEQDETRKTRGTHNDTH